MRQKITKEKEAGNKILFLIYVSNRLFSVI